MGVSLNGCNSCWVPPFYTSNLFVLYFWASTLQNRVFSNQHRGHLGSMYILNIYIYIYIIYIFIHVKYTHKFFLVLFEVMSLVEAALKVGGETLRFLHFSKEGTMVFGKKTGRTKKGAAKQVGVLFFFFFFKWNMYTRREVKKKS